MKLSAASVILLLATACGTSTWNGRVETWGTMREVMRDGKTDARVSLGDVTSSSGAIGIGALEGLTGEIALVDGTWWIARVDGDRLECSKGVRRGDSATLLAVADVPRWWTVPIDHDVAAADFDALLARTARDMGLWQPAWPFVVEGELVGVEAHVLRGECPFAGEVSAEHEPIRRSFANVRGRLVGFHAPGSGGELVHHGQASHVHVILEQPEPFVGHVDAVGVAAGALLLVPAQR
jgi:alpha-acetolactate decarboxylase